MMQTVFASNSLRVATCAPAALSRIARIVSRTCSTYRCVEGSVVQQTSPLSLLFGPGFDTAASLGPEQQRQNVEVLRYRTEFPASMWGHLSGLLQARPFPTAVDMSCAAPGAAGAELAQRGFCVAEELPPGVGSCYDRLPSECSDLVTCLPGPASMAASELLAEARRLMCKGGYLAVAWNDRDLSSPFVSDLESLLESINPDYCRSSKQHNPPAWTNTLTDGGSLRLVSFTAHPHGLALTHSGALQDLLGGLACARAHLAASSTTRKHFNREVSRLVQQHYGDQRPIELPVVTKLYVLRKQLAATHALQAGCSAADAEAAAADDDDAGNGLLRHVRTRSTR